MSAVDARACELEEGEVATLFQLAMMGGLPFSRLRDGMFSHPAIAESLDNLFTSLDRSA